LEFQSGEKLIAEGAFDNDVYLIVAGTVSVVIKGNEVRTLAVGHHVGEMSAVEPSSTAIRDSHNARHGCCTKGSGCGFCPHLRQVSFDVEADCARAIASAFRS
jgi:hypothetical protein